MSTSAGTPPWETLARLLRHPVRAQALLRYAESVTSPSAVAAALGAPVNVVSHHTQVLLRAGAIELVRTEPRRGVKEHFYRAVSPLELEDAEWNGLPLKLRRALSRLLIDGVRRDAVDALADGGMDGESTHLSRLYLRLDQRGAAELSALLRDTYAGAKEIARASRGRPAEDAGYELVMMSFQRASGP